MGDGGGALAIQRQPAVSAGAEAQIVAAAPDMQVVAGPGRDVAGVVGHLIGLKPGALEHGLRRFIEGRRQILVGRGEGPAREGPAEGRRRLNGQLIGRDVFETEVQRRGQFRGPVDHRLPRPGVDQVDRQAREGLARRLDRPPGLRRRMVAAEEGQRSVVERLHPHRQAVDPGGGQSGVAARLGVGGVGLQRDFDLAVRRKERLGPRDHFRHSLGRHQRRRAAAKEDRGQTARSDQRRLRLHVRQDGLDQPGLLLDPPPVAHDVEVAIGTDAGAVGPVDIESEGAFLVPIAAFAEGGCMREGLSQSAPP
ncbi:hypothetical protein D3C86_910560 [compost metagenome]